MNWKYILIVFALMSCQKESLNEGINKPFEKSFNDGFDNSDYFIYKRELNGNSYFTSTQISDSIKQNFNTLEWDLNGGGTNIIDLIICSENYGNTCFDVSLDSLIIDQEYSSQYLVNYFGEITVDGVNYQQAMFGFLHKWQYGQSEQFKTMKLELITQDETLTYYFQSWQ